MYPLRLIIGSILRLSLSEFGLKLRPFTFAIRKNSLDIAPSLHEGRKHIINRRGNIAYSVVFIFYYCQTSEVTHLHFSARSQRKWTTPLFASFLVLPIGLPLLAIIPRTILIADTSSQMRCMSNSVSDGSSSKPLTRIQWMESLLPKSIFADGYYFIIGASNSDSSEVFALPNMRHLDQPPFT